MKSVAAKLQRAFFSCHPRQRKPFSATTILGIETTCDETGVCILSVGPTDNKTTILAQGLASQWAMVDEWGGVVPKLAAREHERNLPVLLDAALEESGLHYSSLDAIAVSTGPGLAPCLRVGFQAAADLCIHHKLPLIAVNHLEAHISVARLQRPDVVFPFLALLVSGGHTQLIYARGIGQYDILGTTLDDAIGEAYDKVARLLELDTTGESAGAVVERIALEGNPKAFTLPIPLQHIKDCNFSYSGLKSSLRRLVMKLKREHSLECLDQQQQRDLAACFQHAAIKHIKKRTQRALEWCRDEADLLPVQHLVLCGGVAANQAVRQGLLDVLEDEACELVVPPREHCTDNGVMVAFTGLEKHKLGHFDSPYVSIVPRWPIGPMYSAALSAPVRE